MHELTIDAPEAGINMMTKSYAVAIFLTLWTLFVSPSARAAINLALKRPYTLSHPPNYPYCTDPGDATDLTDGIR